MSKAKSKQACETTGVNAKMLRKAIAYWKKERYRCDVDLSVTIESDVFMASVQSLSYVASLPPPPLPGTPTYYRCINDWYRCYMQASYLDGYRNQIAQMQQQVTNGEIMLTGYLEGYAQCVGGFPA